MQALKFFCQMKGNSQEFQEQACKAFQGSRALSNHSVAGSVKDSSPQSDRCAEAKLRGAGARLMTTTQGLGFRVQGRVFLRLASQQDKSLRFFPSERSRVVQLFLRSLATSKLNLLLVSCCCLVGSEGVRYPASSFNGYIWGDKG